MRLRRERDEGITVHVSDEALREGADALRDWLGEHPGLTEGHYGYWPIAVRDGRVLERDDELAEWVEGADRAVRIHELQQQTCWDLASGFEPPRAEATAVVAPGALLGDRLDLVRYEYLAPQSGWFLGGERGERVPLHQIVAARPEVLEFLALEPGWSVSVRADGARVKRRPG
jgi:hypothetical protein